MAKAIWKGIVLAESDQTRVVEGNHYFPPDSIHWEYFSENQHSSVCPWKGVAGYYDIEVDGQVNRSAAWTYPDPSNAASQIKGYIAFWHGVKVIRGENGQESGVLDRLRNLFN
jgi:uncharacterized protein (DUF427 family)